MWDGPVIDAHHHLWQPEDARGSVYPDPSLMTPCEWPQMRRAAGSAIEGSVLVHVAEDDTDRELIGLVRRAATAPWPVAIVPWARLEDPSVGARLQHLAAVGWVRGVRRGTQAEPDPLFAARASFIAGMRHVGELGLVGEVCVLSHQLPGVIALADACPGTTIVVDHLGKPDPTRADLPAWRDSMAELALRPNVCCKISVVVRSADDAPLDEDWVGAAITWVVKRFGFGRVVFGSNWPVASLVTGYQEWVRVVSHAVAGARESELLALFRDNARALYRIGEDKAAAS
jgi:L-fuconolactonase